MATAQTQPHQLPQSIHNLTVAPSGTKMWLLHLGNLECDEGWVTRGGATSTFSNPNAPRQRRRLVMIAILIEHPTDGLLLYETGAGKDYPEAIGPPVNDIFARVDHKEEYNLDKAIEKCGKSIKDVKGVVLGHAHLDHAGGLEHFAGTDVPVYAHEKELKHAFFSVATKTDIGVYQPRDIRLDVNWVPIFGSSFELAQGITLVHAPGHTPGLMALQVNLPQSGTWLATTDHCHVKENWEETLPQGWLARDHDDWMRSSAVLKEIVKRTRGRVLFGHCRETLYSYKVAPEYYE